MASKKGSKNLIINNPKSLLTIGVFLLLLIFGFSQVWAVFQAENHETFFASVVGDFDIGDGDVNMMIYRKNESGEYVRSFVIPSAYYILNDNLTSCSKYCDQDPEICTIAYTKVNCNESDICSYTFDSTTRNLSLTSTEKITCKFYFDEVADSDINVFVLKENSGGIYLNSNNSKRYSIIENIPAYGYKYIDDYNCDVASATVTYNSETRTFNVASGQKTTCYVYFDQEGSTDVTVKAFVEESYGSGIYVEVDSIPNSRVYTLNSSSSCTPVASGGAQATIKYEDGYIVIDATEAQTCQVFLDLVES